MYLGIFRRADGSELDPCWPISTLGLSLHMNGGGFYKPLKTTSHRNCDDADLNATSTSATLSFWSPMVLRGQKHDARESLLSPSPSAAKRACNSAGLSWGSQQALALLCTSCIAGRNNSSSCVAAVCLDEGALSLTADQQQLVDLPPGRKADGQTTLHLPL